MPKAGSPHTVQRRLAAILSADVAGYTRQMNADEGGTLRLLTAHRQTANRIIVQHGGRIANTAGDSILVEFPSAVDALQCGLDIQERVAAVNDDVPEERRIIFRMGLHVGEVMVRDGDLFGDGVNVAARLQGLAPPGLVCLSDAAHHFVYRALPLPFEDLGPQLLKNLDAPVRAYLARPARPAGKAPSRALPSAHHRRVEAHLARRFHDVCERALTEITRTEKLAVLEYAFLSALWDSPGVDQAWLVDCFGTSATETSRIVALLESRGFIERSHKTGDRRVDAFSLTPSGADVRQRIRPAIVIALDRIMTPLSESERETLKDLLARIIQANESQMAP